MTIPNHIDSMDMDDAFDTLTAAISGAQAHWDTLANYATKQDEQEYATAVKRVYGQMMALANNLIAVVEEHPVSVHRPHVMGSPDRLASLRDPNEHALRQDELV